MLATASLILALAGSPRAGVTVTAIVSPTTFDESPVLRRLMPLSAPSGGIAHEEDEGDDLLPLPMVRHDEVAQMSAPPPSLEPPLLNVEGIGAGLDGHNVTPPDSNGDIGPLHYVQVVNSQIAIFAKSGTLVYGPTQTLTLFSGFPGPCSYQDSGDPIAVYDALADRWIVSYMSWTEESTHQCIAVSTTADPLGSWYRYAFPYPAKNDYGKLAVWPNAYVFTTSLINTPTVSGAMVCALDRAHMLHGELTNQQCFLRDSDQPLPADLDGPVQPPAGSPAYLLYSPIFGNALGISKLYVDWVNPANSLLTAQDDIPIADYSPSCPACVAQPRTASTLATSTGFLMNRFTYRNFGDHESFVANHAADVGGVTGIRWYEIRIDSSDPGHPHVFQQGTWTPDSNHRWLASAAMDGRGDLAVAYSVSSESVYPGIRYSGRLYSDTLGLLTLGERAILDGRASQTWSNRWGDYSALQVDPVDDCTFWYTNEYATARGSGTRIAAFRLPQCGTFTLTTRADPLKVGAGSSITSEIATQPTNETPDTIQLRPVGAPSWLKATLRPASVRAGESATLEITTDASAPADALVVVGLEGTSPTFRTNTTVVVQVSSGDPATTNTGCSTAGGAPILLIAIAAAVRGSGWIRRRYEMRR